MTAGAPSTVQQPSARLPERRRAFKAFGRNMAEAYNFAVDA